MELALAIQDTVGRAKLSKTAYLAQVYGLAWTRKVSESLPYLIKGYSVGMQLGETVFATWNLYFSRTSLPFFLGRPLDQLQRDSLKVLSQVEELGLIGQSVVTRMLLQMFINLSDTSISQSTVLEGEMMIPTIRNHEDAIFYPPSYHVGLLFLRLIFSQYEAAAELALENGDLYPKALPGAATIIFETFYRAAALYAAARQTKKKKFKKAGNKLRKRFVGWKRAGNPNVDYFLLFLDAESAALDSKQEQAKSKYLEAIAVASQDGNLQCEAFFNERYADYLSQDPTSADEAEKRRSEAIRAYREWGAHAKVVQMRGET